MEKIDMKKKNAAAIMLSLALTGAILTSCGKGQGSDEKMPQDAPQSTVQEASPDPVADGPGTDRTEAGPAKTDGPDLSGYEDNFAVDSNAAKEFAEKVKAAAAKKDLEALAALTAFPVYVGLPDVGVVESREAFLALGADAVFSEVLLKSIEDADIEGFEPSMAGFSISDGGTANINFGVVDGALAINGINY